MACIGYEVVRQTELISFHVHLDQFLFIVGLHADLLLTLPHVLLHDLGPVFAAICHSFCSVERAEGCMTTLRTDFAFAHFEIVADDENHLDVTHFAVLLKQLFVADFGDGTIALVLKA